LLARSLGWEDNAEFGEFFAWKHDHNPFGSSPSWVAIADGRVVGFRTFLQWRFEHPDGRPRRAVRAVDTATSPDFHRRGIFRLLTSNALEELREEGFDFIFNTPNAQSRAGYLQMGWVEIGRVHTAVRMARLSSARRLLANRVRADRWALACDVGVPAPAVLSDARVELLLDRQPRPPRLRTARSLEYWRWRYGHGPHGYRSLAADGDPAKGLAIFRVRHRGSAIEAVVSEVVVSNDDSCTRRELLELVARASGADYAVIMGMSALRAGFVRVPRIGPVLTWRTLSDDPAPARISDVDLVLGDVEVF
jgi:GNAT superfamily N-acetyltransferase